MRLLQGRVAECDVEIEKTLAVLNADKVAPAEPLPAPRYRTRQPNAVAFDTRPALYSSLAQT